MASQPRAKDYDHLVKLLLIGDSGERRDERKRKEEAREKSQFFFKCSRSLNLATQFQKLPLSSPFKKASASPASCCASPTTRSRAASSRRSGELIDREDDR
jgi:hypothetical protein